MIETQELASKQPLGNRPQHPSSMASTFAQESVHICKKVEKNLVAWMHFHLRDIFAQYDIKTNGHYIIS